MTDERSQSRLGRREALLIAAGVPGAAAQLSGLWLAVWIFVALGFHGTVGYTAIKFAIEKPGAPADKDRVEYVRVELPDEPEPAKEEPAPEPEQEPEVAEVEPIEQVEDEAIEEVEEVQETTQEQEVVEVEQETTRRRRPRDPDSTSSGPKSDAPVFDYAGVDPTSLADNGTVAAPTGSPDGVRKRRRRPEEPKETGGGGGTGDGVGDGGGEPVKPKPVERRKLSKKAKPNETFNRKIKAEYPPALEADGIEADVVAVVTIDEKGKVVDVRIVNRVDPAFAKAAEKAFKRFRFTPALQEGKPVASELRLIYRFRLDE